MVGILLCLWGRIFLALLLKDEMNLHVLLLWEEDDSRRLLLPVELHKFSFKESSSIPLNSLLSARLVTSVADLSFDNLIVSPDLDDSRDIGVVGA